MVNGIHGSHPTDARLLIEWLCASVAVGAGRQAELAEFLLLPSGVLLAHILPGSMQPGRLPMGPRPIWLPVAWCYEVRLHRGFQPQQYRP